MHVEQSERWPGLQDDVRALFSVLAAIRWRLGLEQALLFALRGLIFGAGGVATLSLAIWLTSAPNLRTGYPWLVCVPLVVALGWAWRRWPSDRQAAITADRRLRLDERLGTAVEIALNPTGRFDGVQMQDAVHRARAVGRGAIALDAGVRREGVVALALLVVAGATLLLPNLPRPSVLAPDESARLTDAQPPVAIDSATAEEAAVPTVADASSTNESPADPSLAARVQQEQAESAALDRLSKALGAVSAAQPAADAIQRGDFSQARDQLTRLGEEADQLSDAAKQQLSKALQQAASQTAASDRQLADRERQAAQALSRPSYNEQRQALNALADQVERSGQRSTAPSQLARDAGRLQQQTGGESQDRQPAAQSRGNAPQAQAAAADGAPSASQQSSAEGGRQGAGAAAQQGGSGTGEGPNPDGLGTAPSNLDAAGQTVDVPTKLGSGPGVRPPNGAEDQTGTDPTTGARSVDELVQAQRTGEVAPEQNLVPGEQRPVVRGYFR